MVVASYLSHKYFSFGGAADDGSRGHEERKDVSREHACTVLTPCFNEEENVREVYEQVRRAMATVPDCEYEHLFIDNASEDGTVDVLREMAAEDERVKVIVNTRNFGPIRSPYHGVPAGARGGGHALRRRPAGPAGALPQLRGEVGRGLQGRHRHQGGQQESRLMFAVRRLYYWLIGRLSSDVELVSNFTGFGLYDREVVERFRSTNEQYPYFRGLVCDFGYDARRSSTCSRRAARGTRRTTSTASTTRPCSASPTTPRCRCASPRWPASRSRILSLLVAFVYLVAKLVFWNYIQLGLAPPLIGIYFFGAVQLFFIGMLGEYIGSIHTQVHRRPLVVERERINLEGRPELPESVLTTRETLPG